MVLIDHPLVMAYKHAVAKLSHLPYHRFIWCSGRHPVPEGPPGNHGSAWLMVGRQRHLLLRLLMPYIARGARASTFAVLYLLKGHRLDPILAPVWMFHFGHWCLDCCHSTTTTAQTRCSCRMEASLASLPSTCRFCKGHSTQASASGTKWRTYG